MIGCIQSCKISYILQRHSHKPFARSNYQMHKNITERIETYFMTMKDTNAKSAASARSSLSYPSCIVVIALIVLTTLNSFGATNLTATIMKLPCNCTVDSSRTTGSVPAKAISIPEAKTISTPEAKAISTVDATAAPASKLQRYLNVNDGGIHACAKFTTRYEASHLIPWLYYHRRVGISFFHLYVIVHH